MPDASYPDSAEAKIPDDFEIQLIAANTRNLPRQMNPEVIAADFYAIIIVV